MADFEEALNETLKNEGVYSYHPDDRGGETYMGIARRFHPGWKGWQVIDLIKKNQSSGWTELDKKSIINRNLQDNEELQKHVKDFYYMEFWKPIRGDEILLQQIANKIFDLAVNVGIFPAVRFLQESLNMLNRNQKDYPDIKVDGKFGKQTLSTLRRHLQLSQYTSYGTDLLKMISAFQARYYIEIMRSHPEQRVFARGWMGRVWD
ncbi:MAG: hypothetical protein KAW12_07165 [Candidatus Aminicenantes bacterium]|nr:hypothetical protein [Candidatus Aminicenantes bacterium]